MLTDEQSMAVIKQILKRLVPLRTRNFVRLALKRHPIQYRSRWPDLEMFNLARNDVVFDVGANVGWFVECVLAYQPWAIVHAFEPVPQAFAVLQTTFKDYSDIYCRNIALGSQAGQKPINVSRFVEASSFLDSGKLLNDRVYGIDFSVQETLPVAIRTLADYAKEQAITSIKLLKLDVQGYEMEVLKGAEPVFDMVEFIYAEAQFQELYKGGPLFHDLFEFLNRRQFELVRMTSFRSDDEGRLMECDMIFKNRQRANSQAATR
jgi:FkbM family methyltransferase